MRPIPGTVTEYGIEHKGSGPSDRKLQDVVTKIVSRFTGESGVQAVETIQDTVGLARGPAQYVLVELANGQRFLVSAAEVFR